MKNHETKAVTIKQAMSVFQEQTLSKDFEATLHEALRNEGDFIMTQQTKKKNNMFFKRFLPACAVLVLILGSLWVEGNSNYNNIEKVTRQDNGSKMATSAYQENSIMEDSFEYAVSAGGSSDSNFAMPVAAKQSSDTTTTDTKLIKTLYFNLQSNAFDKDVQSILNAISANNGYVENKNSYSPRNQTRTMDWFIRIPSTNLDAFVSELSSVAHIVEENERIEDVTLQYVDNEARLKTLYDKKERLSTLMTTASNVDELISIESELANTQYQIDSYETSQRTLNNRIEMSEVSITLSEEKSEIITTTTSLSLLDRIQLAIDASLKNTVQFFENMIIFIVLTWPILLLLCVVYGIYIFFKKRGKHV